MGVIGANLPQNRQLVTARVSILDRFKPYNYQPLSLCLEDRSHVSRKRIAQIKTVASQQTKKTESVLKIRVFIFYLRFSVPSFFILTIYF